MLRPALVGLVVMLSGCFRTPLIKPHQPKERATLFSAVRIFDGKLDTVSEPVDVLVRDGRIVQLGPVVPADDGAAIVDGRGKVLMPGLFDAHVHLGNSEGEPPWEIGKHLPDREAQAAALLYSGVTTVVLAGHDTDSKALAADITARRCAGPRLLRATRIMTAVGGHPVYMYESATPSLLAKYVIRQGVMQVKGEDEARAFVRAEVEEQQPHHLKAVYHSMPSSVPMLTRQELTAAIDEAKKLNLPAYVHVGTSQGAVEAAQAGATMLMHTPWEDRLSPEQVTLIAATGVAVVTTRRIYTAMNAVTLGLPTFSALEREVMAPGMEQTYFHKPEGYVLKGWEDLPEKMPAWDENVGLNVRALVQAGVTMVAGTDTGIPGVLPGAGLHEELKSLVALGLTPAQVLKMATSSAAKVVDPGGKRGVIEVGAVADLLLLDADPVADIAAIDRIAGVWTRGERQR